MSAGSVAKHASPKRQIIPADDDPEARIAELLREAEKATIDDESAAVAHDVLVLPGTMRDNEPRANGAPLESQL